MTRVLRHPSLEYTFARPSAVEGEVEGASAVVVLHAVQSCVLCARGGVRGLERAYRGAGLGAGVLVVGIGLGLTGPASKCRCRQAERGAVWVCHCEVAQPMCRGPWPWSLVLALALSVACYSTFA